MPNNQNNFSEDEISDEDDSVNNQQEREEEVLEKPLECSECRKPIAIRYTEIVGKHITCNGMCADCPVVQQRLHGFHHTHVPVASTEKETELCCGNCGVTLETVRKGNLLGCSSCYEVFGDIIVSEIAAVNKVAPRVIANRKSMPLHIGRSPGDTREINPALRLLVLNEALSETLNREDYEQAAWLRDQIKAITELKNEEKKKGKDEGKE